MDINKNTADYKYIEETACVILISRDTKLLVDFTFLNAMTVTKEDVRTAMQELADRNFFKHNVFHL